MIDTLKTTAHLAIDTQSLGQLRAQAKQSPEQALKAAAQQFEAVFMNMMLKSMREATPQDSMMDSDQTRMFTGMLDQQLAQSMSTRGIGLADMMVRQLSNSGQAGIPAAVLHSETGASAPLFRGNAPAASVRLPKTATPTGRTCPGIPASLHRSPSHSSRRHSCIRYVRQQPEGTARYSDWIY